MQIIKINIMNILKYPKKNDNKLNVVFKKRIVWEDIN